MHGNPAGRTQRKPPDAFLRAAGARLHRRLVQPPSASLRPGLSQPQRLRARRNCRERAGRGPEPPSVQTPRPRDRAQSTLTGSRPSTHRRKLVRQRYGYLRRGCQRPACCAPAGAMQTSRLPFHPGLDSLAGIREGSGSWVRGTFRATARCASFAAGTWGSSRGCSWRWCEWRASWGWRVSGSCR